MILQGLMIYPACAALLAINDILYEKDTSIFSRTVIRFYF